MVHTSTHWHEKCRWKSPRKKWIPNIQCFLTSAKKAEEDRETWEKSHCAIECQISKALASSQGEKMASVGKNLLRFAVIFFLCYCAFQCVADFYALEGLIQWYKSWFQRWREDKYPPFSGWDFSSVWQIMAMSIYRKHAKSFLVAFFSFLWSSGE